MSPILFLLYINDLPENVHSQVRLFADDTAVYLTVQGPNDSKRLQSDLNVLQEWERKWDMEFNLSKCQILHITLSRNPVRYNYTMHGQTLESVENAWYLGVDISLGLGFSHHINRISSNAQKTLVFSKEIKKTTHSGIREAAYKTIVRPQLEYTSTTWSPYTKKTYTRLRWCRGGRSVGYVVIVLLLYAVRLRSQITGAEAG